MGRRRGEARPVQGIRSSSRNRKRKSSQGVSVESPNLQNSIEENSSEIPLSPIPKKRERFRNDDHIAIAASSYLANNYQIVEDSSFSVIPRPPPVRGRGGKRGRPRKSSPLTIISLRENRSTRNGNNIEDEPLKTNISELTTLQNEEPNCDTTSFEIQGTSGSCDSPPRDLIGAGPASVVAINSSAKQSSPELFSNISEIVNQKAMNSNCVTSHVKHPSDAEPSLSVMISCSTVEMEDSIMERRKCFNGSNSDSPPSIHACDERTPSVTSQRINSNSSSFENVHNEIEPIVVQRTVGTHVAVLSEKNVDVAENFSPVGSFDLLMNSSQSSDMDISDEETTPSPHPTPKKILQHVELSTVANKASNEENSGGLVDAEIIERGPAMPRYDYEPIADNVYFVDDKDYTVHTRCICVAGPCRYSCLNYISQIECGKKCASEECQNNQFSQKRYSKVEPFFAGEKGYGLRAVEFIKRNAFIMEYVGEVVENCKVADRLIYYKKKKIKHHYLMHSTAKTTIDATIRGNATRFINHSCEPNAFCQKWIVSRRPCIGFFALRDIQPGEEIAFDYQFSNWGKAQLCLCGSEKCKGKIGSENANDNAESTQDESSDNENEDEFVGVDKENLRTIPNQQVVKDKLIGLMNLLKDRSINHNNICEDLYDIMADSFTISIRHDVVKFVNSWKNGRMFEHFIKRCLFYVKKWLSDVNGSIPGEFVSPNDRTTFLIEVLNLLKNLTSQNMASMRNCGLESNIRELVAAENPIEFDVASALDALLNKLSGEANGSSLSDLIRKRKVLALDLLERWKEHEQLYIYKIPKKKQNDSFQIPTWASNEVKHAPVKEDDSNKEYAYATREHDWRREPEKYISKEYSQQRPTRFKQWRQNDSENMNGGVTPSRRFSLQNCMKSTINRRNYLEDSSNMRPPLRPPNRHSFVPPVVSGIPPAYNGYSYTFEYDNRMTRTDFFDEMCFAPAYIPPPPVLPPTSVFSNAAPPRAQIEHSPKSQRKSRFEDDKAERILEIGFTEKFRLGSESSSLTNNETRFLDLPYSPFDEHKSVNPHLLQKEIALEVMRRFRNKFVDSCKALDISDTDVISELNHRLWRNDDKYASSTTNNNIKNSSEAFNEELVSMVDSPKPPEEANGEQRMTSRKWIPTFRETVSSPFSHKTPPFDNEPTLSQSTVETECEHARESLSAEERARAIVGDQIALIQNATAERKWKTVLLHGESYFFNKDTRATLWVLPAGQLAEPPDDVTNKIAQNTHAPLFDDEVPNMDIFPVQSSVRNLYDTTHRTSSTDIFQLSSSHDTQESVNQKKLFREAAGKIFIDYLTPYKKELSKDAFKMHARTMNRSFVAKFDDFYGFIVDEDFLINAKQFAEEYVKDRIDHIMRSKKEGSQGRVATESPI